jgi:nucleoside 2-deoxyribosyltransferase
MYIIEGLKTRVQLPPRPPFTININYFMNLLYKTKTYLVGHMQYLSGRNWREEVASQLSSISITCFDPYKKPFIKDVEEDEASRLEMETWMKTKQYDRATERMKTIRSYDLNLVDRSDFIIAHLVPDVASWGSAEEIVTAVRMKKPIFISMEGGKSKTPLWMLGMLPHKYIYNDLNEVIDMIYAIDNGSKPIDSDRWRLLQKKFR